MGGSYATMRAPLCPQRRADHGAARLLGKTLGAHVHGSIRGLAAARGV